MLRAFVIAVPLLATLAACASPQQQRITRMAQMAERTLDRMEVEAPRADPGLVAARDIAFARAARDEGQWTAFHQYAATGARIHGPSGVQSVDVAVPEGLAPVEPMRWAPNAVWSSCNGRMAVSMGKFQTPDGTVGTYATVWQRQRDREMPYKYVYTMGVVDERQPVPRNDAQDLSGDDVIIVEELTAINARTADCPRADGPVAAPPPLFIAPAGRDEETVYSDDRTLLWRWTQGERGERGISVHYLRNGTWEHVLDLATREIEAAAP